MIKYFIIYGLLQKCSNQIKNNSIQHTLARYHYVYFNLNLNIKYFFWDIFIRIFLSNLIRKIIFGQHLDIFSCRSEKNVIFETTKIDFFCL